MSSEVKIKGDSFQWLGPDMSIKILSYLDHPRDLVRASAVSSSWYRFVVENGLCKQLCLKMLPEISDVVHSIGVDNMMEPVSDVLGKSMNWDRLKRNHKVYAFLAFYLTPMMRTKNCISKAITASSTNNYPDESIQNTLESCDKTENSIQNILEPGDRTENRVSYWLSEGVDPPEIPETLVYELYSKICLVTEIHIQPFQAYFHPGSPIYSAREVPFKIGHPRYPVGLEKCIADGMACDYMLGDAQFKWTFKSPMLPMSQENRLQEFKLPEPALCIGGLLLVELYGRVEHQGRFYYMGISHVRVVGLPISPAFGVSRHPPGKYNLEYCPRRDKMDHTCNMFIWADNEDESDEVGNQIESSVAAVGNRIESSVAEVGNQSEISVATLAMEAMEAERKKTTKLQKKLNAERLKGKILKFSLLVSITFNLFLCIKYAF